MILCTYYMFMYEVMRDIDRCCYQLNSSKFWLGIRPGRDSLLLILLGMAYRQSQYEWRLWEAGHLSETMIVHASECPNVGNCA
jgi:hypothetical protein